MIRFALIGLAALAFSGCTTMCWDMLFPDPELEGVELFDWESQLSPWPYPVA